MHKHYIGDDIPDTDVTAKSDTLTLDFLRAKLSDLAVLAEIEQVGGDNVKVLVREGIGTTMYLANAINDVSWLKSISHKQEKRGTAVVYHIRLDQKV